MASSTTTNYDVREDRSDYVREAIGVTLPLAILATIGRFESRRLQKTRLNASDYMCIASLVGAIAFSALTLGSTYRILLCN